MRQINLDTYLNKVISVMTEYFGADVGLCDVHPGLLNYSQQKALKDMSPVIYTTLTHVMDVSKLDSGQVVNNVRVLSFVLAYDLLPQDRDRVIRNLLFRMTQLLAGQKWDLDYTFTPKEIQSFDLHGLLRSPDEVIGTKGWSPTLQARAKDLFGVLDPEKDPQFSIWAITWEQQLVFEYLDPPQPFRFPSIMEFLDRMDTRIPNVKALKLSDWFSEVGGYGARILKGSLEIVPPDQDAPLIAHYSVYWAGANGERLREARVLRVATGNPLTFPLPESLVVPPDAKYLHAHAFNQHGVSPQPATVQVADIWLAGTDLSASVSGHFVVGYRGSIVLLDGPDSLAVLGAGKRGNLAYLLVQKGSNPAVAVHDLVADALETGLMEYLPSGMENDRAALPGAIVGDTFYVLTDDGQGFTGGLLACQLTDGLDPNQRWLVDTDYVNDEGSPAAPSFKRKSFGICAGSHQLYLVGGESDTDPYLKHVSSYHPKQRKWHELKPLGTPLKACCCLIDSMKLYVFGGEIQGGTVTDEVHCYDFLLEKWSSLPPMQQPRKAASAVIMGGNIYVTGGKDANGSDLNSSEIYIPFK